MRKIFVASAFCLAGVAFAANENAPVAGALDDAQIAQILQVANEGEIDAAKTALKHAKNPAAKAFAQKMEKEHSDNEKKEKTVAKQQSIDFKDSDKSHALEDDAKSKISKLKDQKKENFDKAYIESQIKMHQALLGDLEATLIPSAKNAAFKAYLQETCRHVRMHLAEAKKINQKL